MFCNMKIFYQNLLKERAYHLEKESINRMDRRSREVIRIDWKDTHKIWMLSYSDFNTCFNIHIDSSETQINSINKQNKWSIDY